MEDPGDAAWAACREGGARAPGHLRFPLKGSLKAEIDIDVEVDVDMEIWVAVKELKLNYQNMDIYQVTWFLDYGH